MHVDPEEGDLGVFPVAGALWLAVVPGVHHPDEVVQGLHLDRHDARAAGRSHDRGEVGVVGAVGGREAVVAALDDVGLVEEGLGRGLEGRELRFKLINNCSERIGVQQYNVLTELKHVNFRVR